MDILDHIYYESSSSYKLYGMGETTVEDIIYFTQYQIEDILQKNELDSIDIVEISICGSRINENPHKDADLDIVLYYKGNINPNDLYKLLHDDKYIDQLTYQKVYIDIKVELVK